MVEFLRLSKRRGALANIFHYIFNIVFAIAVVGLTVVFSNNPWPAVILLFISKWRTIAVRPRYWWANILSSLPDLFLGLGVITLSWQVGATASGAGAAIAQVILAVLYVVWLVFVKPGEGKTWVLIQSQVAQFVALLALFTIAYLLPLEVTVLAAALIAFASARQAIGLYAEKASLLLELAWTFIVAQLAFAGWHWTVLYQISSGVRVPQTALIIGVLGFVAARIYVSLQDDNKLSWNEVGWPFIFSGVILILLVFVGGGLF